MARDPQRIMDLNKGMGGGNRLCGMFDVVAVDGKRECISLELRESPRCIMDMVNKSVIATAIRKELSPYASYCWIAG